MKRLPVATYRQQKRGGKGMQGVNLKDNDYVEHLFVASTHAYMLFFSTAGKVYRLKVYELPEASRHARGTAIVNLLPLAKGETISAVIATKDFPSDEYLMFATSHGMVKKTSMELYDRTRRDGLIAINLKDNDELISVKPRGAGREGHHGVERRQGHHVGRGRSARHGPRHHGRARHERAAHRAGAGHGDCQAQDTSCSSSPRRATASAPPSREYPEHHRGGQGVFTITMTEKKGLLAAMKIVAPDEEIMIMSEEGVCRAHSRCPASPSSAVPRRACCVMKVADNDRVTAVAIASSGKKKSARNLADGEVSDDQLELLEEESQEGTLSEDDIDE